MPEKQITEERVAEMIRDAIALHRHDGNESQAIDIVNLFGMFKTITVAADLTNTLAATPRSIYEQLFIDTTTATKKLYIYDVPGATWRSCTIA